MRKLYKQELEKVRMVTSTRSKLAKHVTIMREGRTGFKIVPGNTKGRGPLGGPIA